MVCHAYTIGLEVGTQLLEVAIAQLARRHLDAHLVQGGIFARIEVGQMERHPMRHAEAPAEVFVSIRLASAQTEVAMHGLDVVAQRHKGTQERHAVGPSRERYEIPTVLMEQTSGIDIGRYGTEKVIQRRALSPSDTRLQGDKY